MASFVLRRLAASLVLLWLVLSATFLVVQLAPGDPVDILLADRRVTQEVHDATIARLGLDGTLGAQYLRWLASAVRMDWGHAFTGDQRPAMKVVLGAMPATVALALGVMLVRYGLGIGLGLASALRRSSGLDHVIRFFTLLFFALPTFYIGHLMIAVLGVQWGWLPAGGMRGDPPPEGVWATVADLARHALMPSLAVGLSTCGRIVRLIRGSLLEVLDQDYIRAATARGLSRSRVILRHALPNAVGPVIQHMGYSVPALLSGILVAEVVFSWPGIGRVTFLAFNQRDLPVILASVALSATLAILGSLAADLLHGAIDPRVRDAQR